MARTILIEVRVEEMDSIEPEFTFNPKMSYELIPTHEDLDSSIEFVCRKSELTSKLNGFDQTHKVVQKARDTRAIYEEPEQEVGDLVRDAAKSAVKGFHIPALDAIVDSIEEIIAPNRTRDKNSDKGRGE